MNGYLSSGLLLDLIEANAAGGEAQNAKISRNVGWQSTCSIDHVKLHVICSECPGRFGIIAL